MDQNPFNLIEKKILITGASSGIGRQTAISCSQMGAKIILTGRDPKKLKETFLMLEGNEHVSHCANLLNEDEINNLLEKIGKLDGVVHSAGLAKLVPARQITVNHLTEIFSVNTFAPILLTSKLLSKKILNPGASILFIGAVAGHSGAVASTAYSASKSALIGAMRSMALELFKGNIRVNCIAPGYTKTPMLDKLESMVKIDSLYDNAPLGIGDPLDVANACIYFLSDASRWVTRNYFAVDGGMSALLTISN